MTIIQAWKDSLTLCKPSALKLMFLVTLNAMKEVLRVLCVPWFIISVGFLIMISFVLDGVVIAHGVYALVSTGMLLAARPSLHIKDFTYFKEYGLRYVSFLLEASLLILSLVFVVLVFLLAWVMGLFWIGYISVYPTIYLLMNGDLGYLPLMPVFSVLLIGALLGMFGLTEFTVFFYLDRVGSVWQSFKKGLTLIIYNLPMLLLYICIALCIKVAYYFLINLIYGFFYESSCSIGATCYSACVGVRYSLLGLPVYLFSVCLLMNIYTKRVHDQYSLYK